ncbi:lipase family protein [Nocardia suismassiliense]|uniref:Lipase family protein n=1 Tax=Nocardia suismassiliense TaxID=2077092 RepID=A0ABW6R776_9NOCA
MKRALTVMTVVFGVVAAMSGVGAAAPVIPPLLPPVPGVLPPAEDPFYAVPAEVGSESNGAILQSRPVDSLYLNLPMPVDAWQLLYRTSDSHDAPTATVATVMVPRTPWPGPGPRPLVSQQMYEDSVGLQCAPSYALRVGYSAPGNGTQYDQNIQRELANGWAVVVPDYQGPQSQFLAGPMGGHSVLDGVRAARAHGPAGLSPDSPLGLAGYSGGAVATAWAAELQPEYAPELTLSGVALSGWPAQFQAVAHALDGSPFFGFLIAGFIGLDRAYPEYRLTDYLNDHGRAVFADTENDCLNDLLVKHPFAHIAEFSAVPNPFAEPRGVELLDINSLGQRVPHAPIFEFHTTGDEVAPLAQADAVLDWYCAAGVAVDRVRAPGEHVTGILLEVDSTTSYLADRFAGKTAPSQCP